MSNYVKSTNFATKDSLPLGDPAKIVKGTEIDTEFNNIATAVSTKADLLSPAFTGTPTAPTASPGTNTTQLATTAYVVAALQAAYPVGSIYMNAASSTNPATLLGFGTWVAFGAGRMVVGLDSGDALFDTLEETGGSKDAIVVSHTHGVTDPGHTHTVGGSDSLSPGTAGVDRPNALDPVRFTNTGSSTTGISINSTGSSGTNANLPPYIVVRMWKRTA